MQDQVAGQTFYKAYANDTFYILVNNARKPKAIPHKTHEESDLWLDEIFDEENDGPLWGISQISMSRIRNA